MEVKKLDGGNCWTFDITYTARYKIHGDEFIGTTSREISEILNKHRYDTKNRPDKMSLQPTCTNTNTKFQYLKEIYIKNTKENCKKKN